MAFIASLLIKIAFWFVQSDMAAKMVQNLTLLLVNSTTGLIETASSLVKEAAELPITPKEKFKYVFAKLKEAYPKIGDSILNRLIENTWPVIKEEMKESITALGSSDSYKAGYDVGVDKALKGD